MNQMYDISYSTAFHKDLKRLKKRGYDLQLMSAVVSKLQAGQPLDQKYKDHNLTGNWKGYRECHICLTGCLFTRLRIIDWCWFCRVPAPIVI